MIYFDNAASSKVSKTAMNKLVEVNEKSFGNPSSLHNLGVLAEKEIFHTKKVISKLLNTQPEEIYFTSGATEANNLAIFGVAEAYKRDGNHIITQKSEHSSVIEVYKELEKKGFEVTYLDVDHEGYVNLLQLEQAITDRTILLSIMHVNNETGTIQDLESIKKIIDGKKIVLHVDGVQSLAKLKVDVKKIGADIFTFSGHKVHGLKGSGGLFIKNGIKIKPLFYGGMQQDKIRPGTENVFGICAMGASLEELGANIEENALYVKGLKNRLLDIAAEIDGVVVNGDAENGSPYILNLSFIDVRSEVLVHSLESKNIYVGTGAACNSKKKIVMLTSYGKTEKEVESSIRFSLCKNNNMEEVEECITALKEIVPNLRKFTRR